MHTCGNCKRRHLRDAQPRSVLCFQYTYPGRNGEHFVVCSTQEEHPKSDPQNTHVSGFRSVAAVLEQGPTNSTGHSSREVRSCISALS